MSGSGGQSAPARRADTETLPPSLPPTAFAPLQVSRYNSAVTDGRQGCYTRQ